MICFIRKRKRRLSLCLMKLWEKVICFTRWIYWLIKQCLYLALGLFLLLIVLDGFLERQNQFDVRPRRNHTAAELASRDSRWLKQSTLCNSITDDKELVSSDSTSCPEFIQELLPSAERTAFYYHLSYLCLGNFPGLERVIRERAVETQQLSGSSEALLLKCAGTSKNLVTLLLPNLKLSVEKNKPELALKFLDKGKGWISDIITDVKEIVNRYEKHNHDVASSTSDIITEKKQKQTSEMEVLKKIIDGLEEKLLSISEQIEEHEEKIEWKNLNIANIISRITGTGFNIYSMIVLFVETIISHIFKTIESTSEEDQLRALHADSSETIEAQKRLKDIQNQLDKLQIENGQLSRIRSLDEVQKSLSQIQKILLQLQEFWEKVGSLMDMLKKNNFAGKIWIDDLSNMKKEFLQSIDAAEEGWTQFGISCMKANNIFSFQANEAYRFLEISPSSLSEEEWMKEYERVKEKLENIKQNSVCPT